MPSSSFLSVAFSLLLCLAVSSCATSERSEDPAAEAIRAPDTVDQLSLLMSTFHRDPSQRAFSVILAGLAAHDKGLASNTSLMACFILLATKSYALTVEAAQSSPALTAFQKSNAAAFDQWLKDPADSPEKNDVLWMTFFVTGSDEPLDRILATADRNATDLAEEGQGPMIIDLAGHTAAWSYRSNATQWPEVLAHARRHAATSPTAAQAVEDAEAKPEPTLHVPP